MRVPLCTTPFAGTNTSAFRENCMRVPLCTNPFGGSTGLASTVDAVAS